MCTPCSLCTSPMHALSLSSFALPASLPCDVAGDCAKLSEDNRGICFIHCFSKRVNLSLVDETALVSDLPMFENTKNKTNKYVFGTLPSTLPKPFPRIVYKGFVTWNCRSMFTDGDRQSCSSISYIASLCQSHAFVAVTGTQSTVEAIAIFQGRLPNTHVYFFTHGNRHSGGVMLCVCREFLDTCQEYGCYTLEEGRVLYFWWTLPLGAWMWSPHTLSLPKSQNSLHACVL